MMILPAPRSTGAVVWSGPVVDVFNRVQEVVKDAIPIE